MTRIIRFPGVMAVPANHPKFLIPSIIDDFNRPDGPLAGTITTSGAKTWTAPEAVKIVSGRVSMAGVTVSAPATVSASGNDYEVQATLAAVGSTGATAGGGLLVRSAPSKGFIWLSTRISGSTVGYQFWQNSGSANTAIGTQYPVQAQAGDVLKIRAKGGTLTAWVNGVLACTATTDITTGVGVGFMSHEQGTESRWDGFSAAAI